MSQNLVLGVIFGLLAVWQTVRALALTLSVLRRAGATVTPIAQLDGHYRRVAGRVEPGEELLTSPLGQHPCVYYRLVVAEVVRQRRDTRGEGGSEADTWDSRRRLGVEEAGRPFRLADGTGRVEVPVEGLRTRLHPAGSHGPCGGHELPQAVKAELQEQFGERAEPWLSASLPLRVRVDEYRVEEGDEVWVQGVGQPSADSARLAAGGDDRPLQLSDTAPSAMISGMIPKLLSAVFFAVFCGLAASMGLSKAWKDHRWEQRQQQRSQTAPVDSRVEAEDR